MGWPFRDLVWLPTMRQRKVTDKKKPPKGEVLSVGKDDFDEERTCCTIRGHKISRLTVLLVLVGLSWAALGVICVLHEKELAKMYPEKLRRLWFCATHCDYGTTKQDATFAERALARQKHSEKAKDWFEDLVKVCMWRCQEGVKEASEFRDHFGNAVWPDSPDSIIYPPSVFEKYERAARKCVGAGVRPVSEGHLGMEDCGVVHLEGGLAEKGLLSKLQAAFQEYRLSDDWEKRSDRGHLRNKRLEFWPPFRPPFNHSSLLQIPGLRTIVENYLGPDAVFDHMSIIVAEQGKATTAQTHHADTGVARKHLEIHMPLTDITPDLGPTSFCPATHGLAQVGKVGYTGGMNRAVEWWYLTPDHHCSDEGYGLSYAAPLRAGQVTIYDGNTFHAGGANMAGRDRPVLQISWAASEDEIKERDYLDGSFKDFPERRQAMEADIARFREAARASEES